MYHLAETHVDIGIDDTLPKIPGELLVNAFITSEEERLMGIEADLTAEFREENRIPDTDGIQELREVLKRTTAESTVSVDGRKKRKYDLIAVLMWQDPEYFPTTTTQRTLEGCG